MQLFLAEVGFGVGGEQIHGSLGHAKKFPIQTCRLDRANRDSSRGSAHWASSQSESSVFPRFSRTWCAKCVPDEREKRPRI